MKSKHTSDELNEAPLLKSIPAHDPFVVPDGFFERFPHRVQDRLRKPQSFTARAMRAIHGTTLVRWISVGIAIMLLVFGVNHVWNTPPKANGDGHAVVVSMEPEEVDTGTWSESELLWYTEGSSEFMAYAGDNVRTEDLLHYLENEDLPLDLLSEEL